MEMESAFSFWGAGWLWLFVGKVFCLDKLYYVHGG